MNTVTYTVESVKQSIYSKKWFVTFYANCVDAVGEKYVSAVVESGAVFNTKSEANAGGARAVAYFTANKRFPNMCQPF